MTYIKNTWQSGDIVTAEKLNHLEQGVADAWEQLFIVNFVEDSPLEPPTLDKTYQEMVEAYESGKTIFLNNGFQLLCMEYIDDDDPYFEADVDYFTPLNQSDTTAYINSYRYYVHADAGEGELSIANNVHSFAVTPVEM